MSKVYGWIQDNLDGTKTEVLPIIRDEDYLPYLAPVSCVKEREDGTPYFWTLASFHYE